MNVEVLLATYNSEKFLREQLNSLLAQTYQDFVILVRDGGSTDATLTILEEFRSAHPDKFRLIPSNGRSGFLENFSHLLDAGSAEYSFFCDHDDIWMPDKIEKTLKKLWDLEKQYGVTSPCCVHCDLAVIDETGKIKNNSLHKAWHMGTTPEESGYPVDMPLFGCTLAFNKCLKEKALPIAENCVYHDAWFARIAWHFGHIGFVSAPLIQYRIHRTNVSCGTSSGYPAVLFRYVKNLQMSRKILRRNLLDPLEVFLERYSDELSGYHRKRLQAFAKWRQYGVVRRLYYMLKYKIYANGLIRTVGLLFL